MKKNLSEVIFLLDRSGSMGGLTNDTIGGFNSLIEKQKEDDGEAIVTTVLFDNRYEILHDGINLKEIQPLTDKDYFVRGSTALLDAIGITINTVGGRLANMNEEDRPSKVIFIITTDGYENASHEYTKGQIREMVQRQEKDYNWMFMFLGANIDAVSEARDLGINPQYSRTYTASSAGTKSVYSSLARGMSVMRSVDGDLTDEETSELQCCLNGIE